MINPMRILQRHLASIVTFAMLAIVAAPSIVSATAFQNPLGNQNLMGLVDAVIMLIVRVGAILCVVMLIMTGFKFVTARGDSGAIKDARNWLKNTLIGGLIVMGAFGIAQLMKNTVCSVIPGACESIRQP